MRVVPSRHGFVRVLALAHVDEHFVLAPGGDHSAGSVVRSTSARRGTLEGDYLNLARLNRSRYARRGVVPGRCE